MRECIEGDDLEDCVKLKTELVTNEQAAIVELQQQNLALIAQLDQYAITHTFTDIFAQNFPKNNFKYLD